MRRVKSLKVVLLVWAIFLWAVPVSFAASVPQIINYQGTLTDKNGAPVQDGSYNIEFNIYDVATGGTSLWKEKWDGNTSPVIVAGGVFNVMLGALSPLPANFFAEHPNSYLGIKVGADSEMLPRQRVTSVGYAFAAGNGIPKGGIIMWSGTVNQIPDGWALCDGNNGTPNLIDKFVLGAGGSLPATGGSLTHQHGIASNDLNHYHGVYGHTHNYSGSTGSNNNVKQRARDDGTLADTPDSPHSHGYSGTTDGGTAHTTNYASEQGFGGLNHNHGGLTTPGGNILPPYYALAFIMKL